VGSSPIVSTPYDRVVETVRDTKQPGGVYIHCWCGVGRTATVVGCLLIAGGATGDDVATRIDGLRAGSRKASRPAPETASQRSLLRERSGRPALAPEQRTGQ
jgi:protein tyrosine/serine phosphatase